MLRLASLAGLCLVLAACGGGGKAKPRLTAAAFRAEASRVCTEAQTHAARLAALRKLRPPARDEEIFARWLKAERDAIEAAIPPHDTSDPLFDPYIALTIAEGKIAGFARRLGVDGCR